MQLLRVIFFDLFLFLFRVLDVNFKATFNVSQVRFSFLIII